MKHLLLMRHAKSSWKDPALSDFDRPLNGRGRRTAPRMGALLSSTTHYPQVILCSTAQRAQQTASLIIASLSTKPVLLLEESLYAASAQGILQAVSQTDDRCMSLLVIAHNPGLEELASELDGDFCDALPTASVVDIECDISHWQEISPECGQVQTLYCPRQLFPDA